MFTGIVETTGIVTEVRKEGEKTHYKLSCTFTPELKLGESISHDGVCLTVTEIDERQYSVTAIDTTLRTTNISWQPGSIVNLERAMKANGRLDGHIVQGHVDTVGVVRNIEHNEGSVLIHVEIPLRFAKNIVGKGSICMNGISLTIVEARDHDFSVAIIPHTWAATNLKQLSAGDRVNLEFDIIGKYVERLMAYR